MIRNFAKLVVAAQFLFVQIAWAAPGQKDKEPCSRIPAQASGIESAIANFQNAIVKSIDEMRDVGLLDENKNPTNTRTLISQNAMTFYMTRGEVLFQFKTQLTNDRKKPSKHLIGAWKNEKYIDSREIVTDTSLSAEANLANIKRTLSSFEKSLSQKGIAMNVDKGKRSVAGTETIAGMDPTTFFMVGLGLTIVTSMGLVILAKGEGLALLGFFIMLAGIIGVPMYAHDAMRGDSRTR